MKRNRQLVYHVWLHRGHDNKVSIVAAGVWNTKKATALCATFVGEFEDEEELKDWLADTEKAAKICEEKLIEIRCDSFYEYFFK